MWSRYDRIVAVMAAVVLMGMGAVFILRQAAPSATWHTEVQRSDAPPEAEPESGQERPDSLLEGEVINLNTATKSDLERLPGIGAGRAEKILAYRQEKGRFSSVKELLRVQGIGNGLFRQIRPYICVN